MNKREKNIETNEAEEEKIVFVVENEQSVQTLENLFQKNKIMILNHLSTLPTIISLRRVFHDGSFVADHEKIVEWRKSLECSSIFFIVSVGNRGEKYMRIAFNSLKDVVKNFYHFAFSIPDYLKMMEGKDVTHYLNLKRKYATHRVKNILELFLLKRDILFDWKVSQKFVNIENKKALKTKNNIVSYLQYTSSFKVHDISTDEYFFVYRGVPTDQDITSFAWTLRDDLFLEEKLNFNKKEIEDALEKESSCMKKINSFVDMMKKYSKNIEFSSESAIKNLFNRLKFTAGVDKELMYEVFEKFIMTVISISHNSYDDNPIVDQNIVPIFLSKQGKGKSTFIMDLMLYNECNHDEDVKNGWCNNVFSVGHKSQNEMRDTILNNKKGVLAEIPEIGLKLMLNDPEFLKAYTSSRSSITRKYSKNSETHISNTSMIFTTNNRKIINDSESRRFPVFDLESIESLKRDDGKYLFDVKSFWGAAYNFWLNNGKSILANCSPELSKRISEHNKKYTIENSLEVIIEDMFDLSDTERKNNYLKKTTFYNILSVLFFNAIKNKKDSELSEKIDSFMEKHNIKHTSYRIPGNSNPRKSLAFPMFNIDILEKILAKKRYDDSFISNEELKIFKTQLDEQKQRYKFNKATKEEEIEKQWNAILCKGEKILEGEFV